MKALWLFRNIPCLKKTEKSSGELKWPNFVWAFTTNLNKDNILYQRLMSNEFVKVNNNYKQLKLWGKLIEKRF